MPQRSSCTEAVHGVKTRRPATWTSMSSGMSSSMRREFRDCLNRGKITRFPQGKRLVDRELNSACSDLEDAKFGFQHSRYKWSTIQGYYSMYHAARALIYSEGYRERSPYCLLVALQELFVDRGMLNPDLAESFREIRGQ